MPLKAGLKPAGFLPRLAAFMIDGLILYPAGMIITAAFGYMSLAGALVGLAVGGFYHVYFIQSTWCATPGKRIMQLMVLRPNGARLDTRGALERHIGMMLPFLVLYSSSLSPVMATILFFWLSLVWFGLIGVTEQKTALHDVLCNTRVYEGKTL